MAGDVAVASGAAPAVRRWPSLGRILSALVLVVFSLISSGSLDSRPPLEQGLSRVTAGEQFSLLYWEVGALGERVVRPITLGYTPGRDPAADRNDVVKFAQLTGELGRISAERDRVVATGTSQQQLTSLGEQAAAISAERERLRPIVETVVAWQIEQVQIGDLIRHGVVDLQPRFSFPFVDVSVVPPVATRLGETPELLAIAPRDRIALIDSVLLNPNLSFQQVDRTESGADTLGVSSVVLGIGGLAAYPSMVPASSSVTWLLQTVAHEWTHHYLAFRPLGQAYFSSYDMRTINETVADIVGQELARQVYARYYSPPLPPWPEPAPPTPSATQPTKPTFDSLMRDIRKHVEEMLARGDVAGADAYMAQQQKELAQQGYYVRVLNTAYLSFFGAYAGSANPYEARLRALRQSSGSLAAYLDRVSSVGQPSELP